MNYRNVRQDFPLLRDNKIIYFDSACQSLRPQVVIDKLVEYYTDYPACGGRSMHRLATRVTTEVDKAREEVANFFNAKKKKEIIFTRNSTEGINLIAYSLGFSSGDVVVTSDKEHNSNLIPWQVLVKKAGVKHFIIPSLEDNTFNLSAYENVLKEHKVRLVSVAHTSNLDGVTNPIEQIIRLAHRNKAKVLIDAAQSAPHQKIDVQKIDADFLVCSGHKMLGPSGTGILYGKQKLLESLQPFLVGGDTVINTTYESHKFLPIPEKFEAGLQDYAGIIGLGEALKYLHKFGMGEIAKKIEGLNAYLTDKLTEIPQIKIVGPHQAKLRGGIVSFYVEGIGAHQIALLLSEQNIMVRSGQHCVHSWFNTHHLRGTVRVSFYFYNTIEEINIFLEKLKRVLEILS